MLLEDKNISPQTQVAFDKLCKKYDDIISKNSGDIGKTMLVEMEIDTGNHPLIASKPYTLSLKHYEWVQREIEKAGIIERSISPWASPVVILKRKVRQANLLEGECVWTTEESTSYNPKSPKQTVEKDVFHLSHSQK